MRMSRILCAAMLCAVAACSKSDSDARDGTDTLTVGGASGTAGASGTGGTSGTSGAVATSAANACLTGTWKKQDGDFTKTFTFNADKTGEEVQSRADKRSFTWSLKNENTVHITYTTPGEAKSDWDLQVDCANNRFAAEYSK